MGHSISLALDLQDDMGIRSTQCDVCVRTSIMHLIQMGHEYVCPLLKRMEGRKYILLY
jgi:hypothetical protein